MPKNAVKDETISKLQFPPLTKNEQGNSSSFTVREHEGTCALGTAGSSYAAGLNSATGKYEGGDGEMVGKRDSEDASPNGHIKSRKDTQERKRG